MVEYFLKNDYGEKLYINYSTIDYRNQKVTLEPGQETRVMTAVIVNPTRDFNLEHLNKLFKDFSIFSIQGEKVFDINSFTKNDMELISKGLHDKFIFHIRYK